LQVEPNVHKIKEHKRKYERLRREREMKKAQAERQRQRAEAEVKLQKIIIIKDFNNSLEISFFVNGGLFFSGCL
jgi:hypothetical protein